MFAKKTEILESTAAEVLESVMKNFIENKHTDSEHEQISDRYVSGNTVKIIFGAMFTYTPQQLSVLKEKALTANNSNLVKNLNQRLKECGSKFINELNYQIMQKKYLKLLKDGTSQPNTILSVQNPTFHYGRNKNRDVNIFPKEFYHKMSTAQENAFIDFSTTLTTCADGSSSSSSTSSSSVFSDITNQHSLSFCLEPPILPDFLSYDNADFFIKAFQENENERTIFPFYNRVTSDFENVGSKTIEQSLAWWHDNTYSSFFNILDNGEWKRKPVLRLNKALLPGSKVYLFGELVYRNSKSHTLEHQNDVLQEQTRVTVSLTSSLHLILHQSIELLLQNQIAKHNSLENPLKMVTQPRLFTSKTKKNFHGIGMLVNSRCLVAHSVIYFEQDSNAASSEWEIVKLTDSPLNMKNVINSGSSGGVGGAYDDEESTKPEVIAGDGSSSDVEINGEDTYIN